MACGENPTARNQIKTLPYVKRSRVTNLLFPTEQSVDSGIRSESTPATSRQYQQSNCACRSPADPAAYQRLSVARRNYFFGPETHGTGQLLLSCYPAGGQVRRYRS